MARKMAARKRENFDILSSLAYNACISSFNPREIQERTAKY